MKRALVTELVCGMRAGSQRDFVEKKIKDEFKSLLDLLLSNAGAEVANIYFQPYFNSIMKYNVATLANHFASELFGIEELADGWLPVRRLRRNRNNVCAIKSELFDGKFILK